MRTDASLRDPAVSGMGALCAMRGVQCLRGVSAVQVHAAILEDLVHPTEIVGKRIRFRSEGKVMKVLLDPKDKNIVEYKLDTYSGMPPQPCCGRASKSLLP
jgi:hypothetical protein